MFSISNVLLYWIIDQIIGVNAASQRKLVKQTYEMSISCLRTNYYGIKHLTEALIPILEQSNSARIVNVSSSFGKLKVNTPYISISFRHQIKFNQHTFIYTCISSSSILFLLQYIPNQILAQTPTINLTNLKVHEYILT